MATHPSARKSPRPLTPEERDKIIVLAAQGLRQNTIARQLDRTQGLVSRVISAAFSDRTLVRELRCNLSKDRADAAREFLGTIDLLKPLQRLSGGTLRAIHLIHLDDAEWRFDEVAFHRRIEEFGSAVARPLIAEVLDRAAAIGITWGGTLRCVIDALDGIRRGRATGPQGAASRMVLPVCGDPHYSMKVAFASSSHLAARLNTWLTGADSNPHSFSGVLATIPEQFTDPQARIIRDFIRLVPGYTRIFGGSGAPALIDRLDTILTSAGNTSADEDPWILEAARSADTSVPELIDAIVGNIGGVFIVRPGAGARQRQLVERINGRWTGLSLRHLEACAARAKSSGAPGVILLATGKKAEIVYQCVRARLVSRLFIDAALARDVERMAKAPAPGGSKG